MSLPRRSRLLYDLRFLVVLIIAMFLFFACSGGASPSVASTTADDPAAEESAATVDEPETDPPSANPTTQAAPATPGASDDIPGDDTPAPSAPVGDPTELVATSIGDFSGPVEIFARPGDDRVFIVEVSGTISAVSPDSSDRTVMLDVSDTTRVQGERGLLGAAYHPSANLLYVHYTNSDSNSVIAEFATDGSGMADPGSERTVLLVDQPFNNHNGGEVAFGPDGYLYLGFGDGGSSDDPNRSALDLSSPLGKILRIDPRATDAAPFTIPSDNPFVDEANADPTIWSYGLRNPWKFSFDAATGDLWIADVGQDMWEEIDTARATDGLDAGRGVSFGWSAFEGFAAFNGDQPTEGHTDPFFTYDRSGGKCSISGGAVSRDPLIPELDGWYVFGDFCTGQIFAIDGGGAADQTAIELARVSELVAIAAGPDGGLYAASFGGAVYRLG